MATGQATEVWKKIAGFEDYSVSSLGRVRRDNGQRPGWIIKAQAESNGYHRVNLYRDQKMFRITVHRLVASAFIGECPEGLQVNHKDGVKGNNHFRNLEYLTGSENRLHAIHVLRRPINPPPPPPCNKGSKHGMSKLTEAKVRQIRKRLAEGIPQSAIALEFGTSQSNICLINRRIAWPHC